MGSFFSAPIRSHFSMCACVFSIQIFVRNCKAFCSFHPRAVHVWTNVCVCVYEISATLNGKYASSDVSRGIPFANGPTAHNMSHYMNFCDRRRLTTQFEQQILFSISPSFLRNAFVHIFSLVAIQGDICSAQTQTRPKISNYLV